MSNNELSSEEKKLAFETIKKMGLFWQGSLVLPIVFLFGFRGFDFLNLKSISILNTIYVSWIYFLFCLIYIAFFSTKYYRVQNKGKYFTAWDLNRPNAGYEFNKHINSNGEFVVLTGFDKFNILLFLIFPCIFLVFGFFLLIKEGINFFSIICIFVPIGSMLYQYLFARNIVKYGNEIGKFVEPAKKRMYIYIILSVVLVLSSFTIALLIALMNPSYVTVPLSNGESLAASYIDSNKLSECMSAGNISLCNFEDNFIAKIVNINELKEKISKKRLFGLDNVEIFLGSVKQQDYMYGEILINRDNFNFTGVCLPGDGRKVEYLDFVAPTWQESKLWNKTQIDEFGGLLLKIWDSKVIAEERGDVFELGKKIHSDFYSCLDNDDGLNSVCCLGIID